MNMKAAVDESSNRARYHDDVKEHLGDEFLEKEQFQFSHKLMS